MSREGRRVLSAERRQLVGATVSVTCQSDGRSHDVPDVELAAGAAHRSGYYTAVCGHVVAAAPMVVPDGEHCPLCAEVFDLHHGHQRPGFSERLFG